MLNREWRCSWSSADRQCSNYIWVINNFIAYQGAPYIRCFTVVQHFQMIITFPTDGLAFLGAKPSADKILTTNLKDILSKFLRYDFGDVIKEQTTPFKMVNEILQNIMTLQLLCSNLTSQTRSRSKNEGLSRAVKEILQRALSWGCSMPWLGLMVTNYGNKKQEVTLTHWPLGDLDVILKMEFSILFYWMVSSDFLMIMPSDMDATGPYWW